MRALRFDRFGDASALRLAEVPDPRLEPGQARVRVHAASINPSDVANVAGRFPHTTLPRTPGRDYAGVVLEGPAEWVGQEVWGTGDGGFTHDGSHAERIVVPAASLRRKPKRLSFEQAASIGVTFTTAWIGVCEYARLQAGETLAVVGSTGGVGGAAVQLGKRLGARIFGVDRSAPDPQSPAARRLEHTLTPAEGDAAERLRALTNGRGAEVVLNTVGGATFEPSVRMLARRGRLAVLASPGQPRVEFNLVDFYHNESQLFGVDSLQRDMTSMAEILEQLAPGFDDGSFDPPVINRVVDLTQALEAYRAVQAGARGRVVLTPASP